MNTLGLLCAFAAVVTCRASLQGPVVSHAVVSHTPAATVAIHAPAAPVVPYASVGLHARVPLAPATSQYRTQDELGQYSFGYSGGPSSRSESRDAYGNVRGSFSYVDSYGNVQSQSYVADDYGFRVIGTDLPRHKRSFGTYPASTGPLSTVSHVAPVVHAGPAVAPVVHTAHSVAPVAHAVHAVAHATSLGGFPYGHHSVPSFSSYNSHLTHPLLSALRHKRSYGSYPASTGPLSTVSHVVAPVVHAAHAVTPVVHAARVVAPTVPALHAVAPVASPPRSFAYGYHAVPSVTSYRSHVAHPLLNHGLAY
ncbi:cuticle protein 19.8-like [Penaeus japonicus]|uniref:cuticle protein 19.8-like n=1 Tax=Penaeus japonicus TaxID=27405 RepID=UPI001C713FBC|nr:cuticle protein 19.8-like [Penaeus japonicus]